MKWFLVAVIVLNVLVGVFSAFRETPRIDLQGREVSPQAITLLPKGWERPQPASAPVAQPAPPQSASAPVASAPAAAKPAKPGKLVDEVNALAVGPDKKPPPKAEAKSAALYCAAWGEFSPAQLTRARGDVALLKLAPSQLSESSRDAGAEGGKAWVYYPPLATRAETQTLSAELKAKGFDNYIVGSAGPYQGHLSLGLFGRESGARALVDKLAKAGYDKAKVEARGAKATLATLNFSKLSDAQWNALRATQKRLFPGIALKAQPCK